MTLTTTPRLAACLAGFLRLGCGYLPSISGDDPIADSPNVKSMGRDVPRADVHRAPQPEQSTHFSHS
jgi:hypothetical protein